MKDLIRQYFDLYQFSDWEKAKEHFEIYLNEDRVIVVEFIFINQPVKWETTLHDIAHEYAKWVLRNEWAKDAKLG